MPRCNFCGNTDGIYGAPARQTAYAGTDWVVFVCPGCGADRGYTAKSELATGAAVQDGKLVIRCQICGDTVLNGTATHFYPDRGGQCEVIFGLRQALKSTALSRAERADLEGDLKIAEGRVRRMIGRSLEGELKP